MALERWMVMAGAALSMACATSASGGGKLGKPVVKFPTWKELEQVAAREARPAAQLPTVEVERWALQGPVPAPGSEYAIASRWDELLKNLVTERGGQVALSSALACAARETARFYVELGAYPSEPVQRYLVARCGSTLVAPRLAVFGGDTPDDVPEEDVQKKLGEKFPEFLKEQIPRATGEVGLSYARGNGRVIIVVYAGETTARLQGFSPIVSGTEAVLEGEMPPDAAFGLALINQGNNGVAFCVADPTVQAPRFRFSCPMLEGDEQARIDVAMRRAGQVLLNPVLAVLVRRNEEAGMVYEPALPGDVKANVDEATFQNAVFAKLNEIRQSAGLGALAFEVGQSQTNARVAPHWFDATFKGDDDTVQLVAMGLLAGWGVDGTIRDGGIYSGFLASSRSPERWLSYALESPLGRSVLLDPKMTRVAIGARSLGTSGMLGVLTTYSFFDSQNHEADELAVFEELSRVRVARGLPAPTKLTKPEALKRALASIASGQSDSATAMKEALKDAKEEEQRTVFGWTMETNDLKQLVWSDQLLQPNPLELSVGVTHYKAPGAAWGQYAVLIVARGAPTAKRRPALEREHNDKLY